MAGASLFGIIYGIETHLLATISQGCLISSSSKNARSEMLGMIASMTWISKLEDHSMKEKVTSDSWSNPILQTSLIKEVMISPFGSWIVVENTLSCMLN